MSRDVVLEVKPLGFPWQTPDLSFHLADRGQFRQWDSLREARQHTALGAAHCT